jgi:DNA-binding transcriptional LysR family regulator
LAGLAAALTLIGRVVGERDHALVSKLGGIEPSSLFLDATGGMTDRDTLLNLVQCRIGIAWITESIRWHCPRGIVLLPVVDMNVRLPFNLIWKKDNSSPLLQKFVTQVQATKITPRN